MFAEQLKKSVITVQMESLPGKPLLVNLPRGVICPDHCGDPGGSGIMVHVFG